MAPSKTRGQRNSPAIRAGAAAAPRATAPAWHPWLWYLALLAATAIAYQPVWHGGLLWDDDAHVIAETLRSWDGLVRLWADFSASQQYYPVSSTAFWVIGAISGSDTTGYHAANILLHATSAMLVILILRRLNAPGAMLAGAIFALHPLYVESVAWISELKNTLSGVCYLGALLAYLRFDEQRSRRAYVTALAMFVLALGSKTVTATLPAGILVILWWQRGRLDLRRDVMPTLPFFAAGALAGLGTAWIEYHWVGASGGRFDLGIVDRLLLAGRVPWFYAAKIIWPVDLSFNYPRWAIDSSVWWQYVFPLALVATIGFLFVIRRRSRAPLAAALYFVGTLFPVIGFLNVYPFRYSFVADHFQYLASLGLVAPLSAAAALAIRRWQPRANHWVTTAFIAVPLGVLTFQHSRVYADPVTLYRDTLVRNPSSILAHGNLGSRLLEGPPSGWPEAMEHGRTMLAIDPDSVAGHNLLGVALQRAGRLEESLRELQRAVELDPQLAGASYNLGLTLDGLGRKEEAVAAYRRALALYPHDVRALHNLANVLRSLKRYDEALTLLRKAITIDPDAVDVKLNFADTLQASGDLTGALAAYREALDRRPDSGEAWNNFGLALRRSGHTTEARMAFETAVRLLPDAPLAHVNLAAVDADAGESDRAVAEYERAIALVPSGPAAARLHEQAAALLMKVGRKAEAAAHLHAAKDLMGR